MSQQPAAMPVIQLPTMPKDLRIAYLALALAGSGAYTASFVRYGAHFVGAAAGEGIAAAVSWLIFAAILVRFAEDRSLFGWIDTCLKTIAVGIAIKTIGLLLNLCNFQMTTREFCILHIAILLIADIVMACIFVPNAMERGMGRRTAILFWLLALNGPVGLFISLGLWLSEWRI